jgi:UDP-N-acetylmuramate: L-alanyl-gamma-D-glutamyl-meso-diaminopimelate ligase
MGGLAQLCIARGWHVEGSDQHVYPPMSDQLSKAGIRLHEGFDPAVLATDIDLVVIGNALSRGNPCVEAVLDQKLPFVSGPELLGQLTQEMHVLAVAGTHGKTTTSSMLAWILDQMGYEPGFLIGGVPTHFGVSARLGGGHYFVVEADEYDTAFFDKRSKFVHYHPDVFGINNLEFDHADIFPTLDAIETQFHHAVRRVPPKGFVVVRNQVESIARVIARGLWSKLISVGADTGVSIQADGSTLEFPACGQRVHWLMRGAHNAANAELAVAMAHAVNVPLDQAFQALSGFSGVARRLNCLYQSAALQVWDDFAHHPTAIQATLDALFTEHPDRPLIAVIELRSNTMRAGTHVEALRDAVRVASEVVWVVPQSISWDATQLLRSATADRLATDIEQLATTLPTCIGTLVFMSNGGFSGLPARVVENLERS